MANEWVHNGVDYFGDEILAGNSIVNDEINGKGFLEENLDHYLFEVCESQIKNDL